MPSKVKIKIVEARDLPIMDRNDASTDAYVEVTIGDLEPNRTKTCRKSLNPVFNTDFIIEVLDDSILQNAPIEFKVMDHDLYTPELIGSVYIDINTLIMRTAHGSEKDRIISGWFPLFDTIKGVRGALHVIVTLTDFIGNSNQFSDASSGVQFFSGSSLASNCFILQEVLGFVTDLVVEDDPESSWQDFFRKNNKTSNDQRLKLLYNLSAIVRCEIGKKVIEMGGNSVLGK
jgi:C2 domain